MCPSAKQYLGSHYDLHNLYGLTETIATANAMKTLRQKRQFVISRSTFPGQGRFGGHWTGDIHSDWNAMSNSISGECVTSRGIFSPPFRPTKIDRAVLLTCSSFPPFPQKV